MYELTVRKDGREFHMIVKAEELMPILNLWLNRGWSAGLKFVEGGIRA